eukprot:SAG31_NODE_3470_length_4235_cov_1.596712_2_plen_1063_part_00
MPCEGDPHRLCGLEGYVQDMLNRGVSAPSGQLSPALWLSGCTNATADPHSGVSNGGWTQPSLRLFLDFLESKGIRSLDIWSQPDREERGANPTTDVPCDWALDELRRWIKQTTSSLKSESSLPDGRQSNLKTDDASVGSNWQLDVDLESAVLPTSNFSTRECSATWVPGAGAYLYCDIVSASNPRWPDSFLSSIGVFHSADGLHNWTYGGIVVPRGAAGSFDAGSAATPGAAYIDGKVVISYTGENGIGSPCGIAVAISSSGGLGPFVKQRRPVATCGNPAAGGVGGGWENISDSCCDDSMLAVDPHDIATLHMYHSYKGHNNNAGHTMHWTPCLQLSPDATHCIVHTISRDAGMSWGPGTAVLHNPLHNLMETMDARILPDGRVVVIVDRENPHGWHDSIGLDLPVYIASNTSSPFVPAIPPTLESSVQFDNITGGFGPACGPQVATIADANGTIIALSTAQFDHPDCVCRRTGWRNGIAAVRTTQPTTVQKFMPDTDISGHDIAGGGCHPAVPVNVTAQECAKSCEGNSKCSAWTWVKPGTPIHPPLPPDMSYCCHKACGKQSPKDGPGCPAVERDHKCCDSGVLDPAAWAPAEPYPIRCGYRHHILPAWIASSPVSRLKTDDIEYNCTSCQGNWSVGFPLVVPSPGCMSIQSTIDCAPDASQLSDGRLEILIRPGVYREKLTVQGTKGPLILQGLSGLADGVTIGWDDADALPGVGRPGCRGASRTQDSAGGDWNSQTLRIESDDFILANITVLNDACGFTGGARNFALMLLGDRTQLSSVRVYGQHDTFFTGGHRAYVKDSYINGSTDFIFGAGSVVFEGCVLVANGGHITAHKGSAMDQDGNTASCGNSSCSTYLIRNSRLPATRHRTAADLGRAWRSRATVVYESTWMGEHIIPQGWGTSMAGCKPEKPKCPNITFGEYNSSGPGADARRRVRWSRQFSATDMEQFTVEQVLHGWVPSTAGFQSARMAKTDDTSFHVASTETAASMKPCPCVPASLCQPLSTAVARPLTKRQAFAVPTGNKVDHRGTVSKNVMDSKRFNFSAATVWTYAYGHPIRF